MFPRRELFIKIEEGGISIYRKSKYINKAAGEILTLGRSQTDQAAAPGLGWAPAAAEKPGCRKGNSGGEAAGCRRRQRSHSRAAPSRNSRAASAAPPGESETHRKQNRRAQPRRPPSPLHRRRLGPPPPSRPLYRRGEAAGLSPAHRAGRRASRGGAAVCPTLAPACRESPAEGSPELGRAATNTPPISSVLLR